MNITLPVFKEYAPALISFFEKSDLIEIRLDFSDFLNDNSRTNTDYFALHCNILEAVAKNKNLREFNLNFVDMRNAEVSDFSKILDRLKLFKELPIKQFQYC